MQHYESNYKFYIRIFLSYYMININMIYNLTIYFVIYRYVLQTSMNKDFIVTNASGVKYKFRVCSALMAHIWE